MRYTTGMIPSPPDERDYPLSKALTYASAPVQDIVVSYIPEPIDQGAYGICVAVTLAGLIEAAEWHQRKTKVLISPKFIYGNRAPTDHQGEGMQPRQALQMATRFGAPRRDLLPGLATYPAAKQAITPAIDGEGLPNRPKGYVRLRTLQDVYDAFVALDLPVMFCMSVTESFKATPSSGVVPPPSGKLLGGHAMRCIGIRTVNGKKRLVIQNSWGVWWGQNGLCYIDLDDGHGDVEMWGIVPEYTESLIKRPQTIMLRVGSKTVMVDSDRYEMDVAPFVQSDRTWVPLRFISEYLGMDVEWHPMQGGDIIILRDGGER